MALTLAANADSPLENACFVIKNWGNRNVSLTIDGKKEPRGKTFRYGFRDNADGTDLVVWLEKATTKPLKIALNPQ